MDMRSQKMDIRRHTSKDRAKDDKRDDGLESSGEQIFLGRRGGLGCFEAGLCKRTDEDSTDANLKKRISCVERFYSTTDRAKVSTEKRLAPVRHLWHQFI